MDNAQWFLSKYDSIHQDWTNETRCFRYKLDAVLQMANQFNDIFDPVKKYANQDDCPFSIKESFSYTISCCEKKPNQVWEGGYPRAKFTTNTANGTANITQEKDNNPEIINFLSKHDSEYFIYFDGLTRTMIREIELVSKTSSEGMKFRVIWHLDQFSVDGYFEGFIDNTLSGFSEDDAEKTFRMPRWDLEYTIGDGEELYYEALEEKFLLHDSGEAFLAMNDVNYFRYFKSCSLRQKLLSLPDYESLCNELNLFLDRIQNI